MFDLQTPLDSIGCSLGSSAGTRTIHLSFSGTIWCLKQDDTCPDVAGDDTQEHYIFNIKVRL